MPAENSSIGVSNKWYKPGFKNLQQVKLPEGIITAIKNHPQANEILAMHIHPLIREERFQMLMENIEVITN